MNVLYCSTHGELDENETRIEPKCETLPVRGEAFEVTSRVRVCNRCDETLFDEVLDESNARLALDAYRLKHSIVSSEEIRAMRERYGLTQRAFAAVLGFGEITIARYERGQVPDLAHARILALVRVPVILRHLISENDADLPAREHEKLLARLDVLLPDVSARITDAIVTSPYYASATWFTGFRRFSEEVFCEMIVYFVERSGSLFKTKLNKLLWYADFSHYQRHAVSIAGTPYVHLPYGPVPDNVDWFVKRLEAQGVIESEEVFYDFGSGISLKAVRPANVSVIGELAVAVMDAVYRYFENYSSKQISEVSHAEAGYAETKLREYISYEYAERLRADVYNSLAS